MLPNPFRCSRFWGTLYGCTLVCFYFIYSVFSFAGTHGGFILERITLFIMFFSLNIFKYEYFLLLLYNELSILNPFPFGYLSIPFYLSRGGEVRCSFQRFRKRGTLLGALLNFHSVVIFNTPLPSQVSPRSV